MLYSYAVTMLSLNEFHFRLFSEENDEEWLVCLIKVTTGKSPL
jgi:hypothetical protein